MQRSSDGRSFETVLIQTVIEARQSSNYSGIDQTPFAGKSFYRIKITEAGRVSYSGIISITSNGKSLNISKLYVDNGSRLTAEINIQKSQFVYMNIVGSTGLVLNKQKEFINQPGTSISIPIGTLPAGQYYLRVITTEGSSITTAFRK